MGDSELQKIANRLGVSEQDTLGKAAEFYNLINLKTFTANDIAKKVLSIVYAANMLGSYCDLEAAVKLSTLGHKEYSRQKQVFEKLLNLQKKLNVGDLCIQLELSSQIKEAALKLLDAYKSKLRVQEDISESQYITMAIYQTCKYMKLKGTKVKPKLLASSRLTNTQWKQLDETWDKWMETEKPLAQKVAKGPSSEQMDIDADSEGNVVHAKDTDHLKLKLKDTEQKTYEEWRSDMLEKAQAIIRMEERPRC